MNMAFNLGRLNKFAPLVGVYAFYNVFATNYPSDPVGGMRTALTNFVADPLGKLQSKISNLTTLAIVIIGVPIALRAFKLPAAVKMLVNLVVYYVIGDQVAAVFNGPGRFGAVSSGARSANVWGGDTSAYHNGIVSQGYTSAANTNRNYME
jgi:hypothetical protein